ncbi:hypothetical protein NDU88_003081 [Pleurodeles waltl]|uniref:Secreted protein n=1 Tax=Pleurodeles waltl TaxID=8319 RepID=A0AAV7M2F8_PLEWA|nr:hypothetical protein NDU88_003081 [Pleurodeles waltl]
MKLQPTIAVAAAAAVPRLCPCPHVALLPLCPPYVGVVVQPQTAKQAASLLREVGTTPGEGGSGQVLQDSASKQHAHGSPRHHRAEPSCGNTGIGQAAAAQRAVGQLLCSR